VSFSLSHRYFLIENLRYVLAQYKPETSLYLGHRFASKFVDAGYNAGGGYVLSKKALEKFVTKLMHDKDHCKIDNFGAEDLELGSCLKNFTLFADTRDELLQKRFFPVGVKEHLNELAENVTYWYDQMMYYDAKYGGLECCSDTFVNAHYAFPKDLYVMDYLIYNVHPFGLQKNLTEQQPRKFTFDELVQRSDAKSNASDFTSHTIYRQLDELEKFKR
jgi:glycoprotein-N-acetylgalactosamine 3-beta-galactosyltransferase